MKPDRVKVVCTMCKQPVALTNSGRLWVHGSPRCPKSRRSYVGRPWPTRHKGRPVRTIPGPDTWNPTNLEGAA